MTTTEPIAGTPAPADTPPAPELSAEDRFTAALQDPKVLATINERREAVAERNAEFAAIRLRYATLIAFIDGSLYALGVEVGDGGVLQPAGTNLAAAQAEAAGDGTAAGSPAAQAAALTDESRAADEARAAAAVSANVDPELAAGVPVTDELDPSPADPDPVDPATVEADPTGWLPPAGEPATDAPPAT